MNTQALKHLDELLQILDLRTENTPIGESAIEIKFESIIGRRNIAIYRPNITTP